MVDVDTGKRAGSVSPVLCWHFSQDCIREWFVRDFVLDEDNVCLHIDIACVSKGADVVALRVSTGVFV
jgi:hypothetical protein